MTRPGAWAVVGGVGLAVAAVASSTAAVVLYRRASSEPAPKVAPAELTIPGRHHVRDLECARCHTGIREDPEVRKDQHCTGCHASILAGTSSYSAADAKRWRPALEPLTEAPSLLSIDRRYRRSWIEGFLLRPSHLRPGLPMHMPRLAIDEQRARELAAFLVPEEPRERPDRAEPERVAAGRRAFAERGCGTCHAFTGAERDAGVPPRPPKVSPSELERGVRLAPDLRVTRARMARRTIVEWLRDPASLKLDARMPKLGIEPEEARDLAAFLLDAPLAEAPKHAFTRLPLLERPVTFDEVDERVFHRICRHCHADRDIAMDGGGPGMSGGFGFGPRRLDLSTFRGIRAGAVDRPPGKGHVDVLAKEGSLLVAALLARHAEEAGEPTGPVRGMPLGYPPLPAEDIQLVETWIAQGARR